MSKLHINIPHSLSQAEALARIKKLLADLRGEQKHMIKDVSETWNGNEGNFSFTLRGFDISGKLGVEPGEVIVKGDIPLVLVFFKGRISEVIKEKAEALLSF